MFRCNRDFSDLLRTFCEEGVEFCIVGAYAIGVAGYVRATGDLGVWVQPSVENAARVYRALAQFGAALDAVTVQDFTSDDLIFQIGIAPNRIDVLTAISGVSWEEGTRGRVTAEYDGLTLPFLGREMLIQNKRASGRPKDRIDIEELERL